MTKVDIISGFLGAGKTTLIKKLLDDPALLSHYKNQAALRGRNFSTEETVRAVEEMLLNL